MKSSNLKVAVVMGGRSSERDVSLSTGVECSRALKTAGYQVTDIDAGIDLLKDILALKPDVVFNALHGKFGEDGCIQGLLDWVGIPYTHSGVLSSALAMDKMRSKAVLAAAGIPVAHGIICAAADVAKGHVLPPPYVVKPNNEGSSVGIYLVGTDSDAPPALSENMPQEVLVEMFVPGRELTVAVLNDKALTVTEIFADGWYDYQAKYTAGGSRHVLPANIPKEIFEACMDYAVRAHKELGCASVSRSDFRWDDRYGVDGIALLEVNTQPGMTPTSLLPEQAAFVGIDFVELVDRIIRNAIR